MIYKQNHFLTKNHNNIEAEWIQKGAQSFPFLAVVRSSVVCIGAVGTRRTEEKPNDTENLKKNTFVN